MFRLHRPHPLKALRDLCVYAPIGFVFEAPHLLPELIDAGRRHVETARGVGRFVAHMGQQHLAARPGASGAVAAETTETADAPTDPGDQHGEEVIVEVIHEPAGALDSDEGLPIPGYDQLAASQVVARLSGLGPVELEQVVAYEEAHRARRTVLNKITQLRRR